MASASMVSVFSAMLNTRSAYGFWVSGAEEDVAWFLGIMGAKYSNLIFPLFS
jgi:hypothetical protein